jgi:putative DNA primase/helicase
MFDRNMTMSIHSHQDDLSWPTPKPIETKLPPVQPFDAEALLPSCLRGWLMDLAERMQVPPDLPSAIGVAVLGGAIGRRAAIQPKAIDTEWTEVPNLWSVIIAEPGMLKTPTVNAVTALVERIESRWRREYLQEMKKWKENQSKDKTAASIDETDKPQAKRLIINDATYEKVQQILSDNPRGAILIRDELAGFFVYCERSGQEGARQFYLTSWGGHSPYHMDRILRGSVPLEHVCLSVVGAIQPSPFREYLVSLSDDASRDGMVQRFQIAVWPDVPHEYHYIDRLPNTDARDQFQRIFEEVLALDPQEPIRFRFSADAQKLFEQWHIELEHRVRQRESHAALIAHLSKYRGLMPSLALIFEIAERASPKCRRGFGGLTGLEYATYPSVSYESALMAVRWCGYLESHARRIYPVFSSNDFAASRLAERIRKRDIGSRGPFTSYRVSQKGWKGLTTPEKVEAAIQLLVASNWIRAVPTAVSPKGGRPTIYYEVNPKVWSLSESSDVSLE